ncbi:GP46-like surface antigen, putative [Bodo saltans]|uniref:GP46-like surface antigen, putative n=1 Tax=Bodo saltans TaxID=75058 RepID=A0A0S4JNM8_BODSA|nr:GP46-like surface antigen, putative [Bodo saltans]|eukprot:CUG93140.1 GP46-like surface antigen, putative [Bodo saltans]
MRHLVPMQPHLVLTLLYFLITRDLVQCLLPDDDVKTLNDFVSSVSFKKNRTPLTSSVCSDEDWRQHISCETNLTSNTSIVTGLNFTGQHLSGTLPPSLANLRHLMSFKLSDNSLTSSIPAEYAQWGSSIVSFWVHVNSLQGTL